MQEIKEYVTIKKEQIKAYSKEISKETGRKSCEDICRSAPRRSECGTGEARQEANRE